jgi:hypothetical protein
VSRLRTVRRLRELEERRAMGRVAGAERELAEARGTLADRVEGLAGMAPPARSLTPLELRVLELQGVAAHDLVRDAASDVELAEDRHAEVVRAWALASTRRKSVERLEETRAAEQAAEARRAADAALDEVVLLRRRTP